MAIPTGHPSPDPAQGDPGPASERGTDPRLPPMRFYPDDDPRSLRHGRLAELPPLSRHALRRALPSADRGDRGDREVRPGEAEGDLEAERAIRRIDRPAS